MYPLALAAELKIWDQNEAINLNQNEIIITLRIYLSVNWAKNVIWIVIIVYGLPLGYRQM